MSSQGTTVQLRAAQVRATIDLAAGGRLGSLFAGGRERLVDRPNAQADLPSLTWGSFAMLPWVGRLRDGQLAWLGASFQLPRNHQGHAIHGATFDRPWDLVVTDERSAMIRHHLGGSDRWPFAAEATQEVRLAEDHITFEVALTAHVAMPAAIGWHPWFQHDPDESVRVTVPATRVLATAADLIPTGEIGPVDDLTDLRRSPDVTGRLLDHAYVDVAGSCRVAWRDLALVIEAEPLGSVVVHTTGRAVCVEPQTAWPDAIRLAALGHDTGLRILQPGETLRAASRWSWNASDL